MPVAAILISLVLFVALAVATIDILRRMSRVLRATRESEAFRRAATDLIARIDFSLEGLAGRIDAVRRHQVLASDIDINLTAAADAVRLYTEELASLRPTPRQASVRDALEKQLARIGRAIELVEHACLILGDEGAGFRDQEAQTSIKRGYLNILHARQAIDQSAADLAEASTTEQELWLIRRRRA